MPRRRKSGRDIDGVLLVDKPQGMTSFTLTEQVRRALSARKAGHTGTLDPLATGLMVVCLGQGTKLVHHLTGQGKSYLATVAFGAETDTYDSEGEITARASESDMAGLSLERIEDALGALRGTIEQRPPAFSAIKVNGRRLHELARAGETVEAPLRTVTIHRLEIVESGLGDSPCPTVSLEVSCSKGTYIRSLAFDLGRALGVGAHLVALRRTVVGPWSVEGAPTLEQIKAAPQEVEAGMLTLADASSEMPTVVLTGRSLEDVAHGRPVADTGLPEGVARGLDEQGRLRAILDVNENGRGRVARGIAISEP